MSLTGLLLGIINIAIVIAILLLVGAIILWFCSWLSFPVPDMVRKLYIAIVALIALYMLVALLLGMPTWHVVRSNVPMGGSTPSIIAPERNG